jgi:hypothetical protein
MTAPTPPGDLTDLAAVNKVLSRSAEDPEAAEMVAAVNSLVPTWLDPGGDGEWSPHQRTGAALLAARLELLKASPGGMAQFGLEGAGYVAGNWPAIAMLLRLGNYAVGRTG